MTAFDDLKASIAKAEDIYAATLTYYTPPVIPTPPILPPISSLSVSTDLSTVMTVGPTLIDTNHHTWSLSSQTGLPAFSDNYILKDGNVAYGGGARNLTIKFGVVYALNSLGQWWKDTGSSWLQISNVDIEKLFAVNQYFKEITDGTIYPTPSEVTQKGYTTITKFDGFDNPSTVDVNNTQNSGYNWYMQTYFVGSSYQNPSPPWATLAPTDVDISNSVLTIKTDVSGFAEGLISTVDNNVPLANRPTPLPGDSSGPYYSVDPEAYKGWAFKNGAYIDYAIKFDPVPFESQTSPWVSVWTQPQSFLTGNDQQGPGINNRNYVELDFFEARLWINPTFSIIQWSNPRPNVGGPSEIINNNNTISLPNVDWTQWNVLGTFWCPMSDNNGTGFLHRYVNNVLIPELTVTWTTGSTYSGLDTQVMPMILGAGVNHPLYVDWVRITQKSVNDLVTK